ncbi:SHOCT domain-containing protein [Nocardioides hankookensis]
MIETLQKLGALRDQGILTEAEFEAQKAKALAGL